jgi:hypothetical protein
LMSMFGQPVCAQSPSGGNLVKALVSRLDLERYKAAEQRAEAGGWWER